MLKPFTKFKDLSLPAPLFGALEKMNFISPTPVQAASLPPALEGKDILGTAQTGTGKTAAFGIPMLTKLYPNPGMKALILAPTRELAAQIHKVLTQMSQGMNLRGALLVGGESFLRQKQDVKGGAHFLVCTPGRLIDHLDAGLKLTRVSVLVLDEVDRMLDMGFEPQLKQIVPHIPRERQTLLFSATLPKEILAIAATYLSEPVRVNIGATSQPTDNVKQESISTTNLKKNDLLLQQLKERKGRVLVFARTQRRTDRLFIMLERNGISVASLHGGRTQNQRKQALHGFHSGTHPVMVATDLAGRGIDVDDIECVINYDLPASREDYIHRIGRTGRNGKVGNALNFLTPEDHGGKNIISAPAPRGPGQAPAAPAARPNKPGWKKGGWETKGGRNRPAFQKRTPQEGYGKVRSERKAPELSSGLKADRPPLPLPQPRQNAVFGTSRPPVPKWKKSGWEARDARPRPEFQKRPRTAGNGKFGLERKFPELSSGFTPSKPRHPGMPRVNGGKPFGDRPLKAGGHFLRTKSQSEGIEERKPFGLKVAGKEPSRQFGPKRQSSSPGGKRRKSYFGQPPR